MGNKSDKTEGVRAGRGTAATSSRDRVRAHREKQRRSGKRLLQVWLPDVTTKKFRAEAHRQSVLVAQSAGAVDDQAFVDAISIWGDL